MKYISFFIIICLLTLISYKSYSEDTLTIKQQLDRIMEEVKDLNKAVFNKSFEKKDYVSNENNSDVERFTSIDIRIYDLEKDIKNLTLQFEEIFFKIDDLSKDILSLKADLNNNLEKIKNDSNIKNNENNKLKNLTEDSIKEENTLGKLIISDKTTIINETESEISNVNEEDKNESEELNNLTPEELLQFALDQMMKKRYEKSKKILEDFIINFSDNQLSGSAHFWLGKIYLFETDYRKAAIVFGEGVQKFPKSIKAAEMYYELVKSLKEMNKTIEACKTLKLLKENYKGNKFSKDPDRIEDKLNCKVNN